MITLAEWLRRQLQERHLTQQAVADCARFLPTTAAQGADREAHS